LDRISSLGLNYEPLSNRILSSWRREEKKVGIWSSFVVLFTKDKLSLYSVENYAICVN
jgi:hypothetical protein